MGAKKISIKDENEILQILRKWPGSKLLSWEDLREHLEKTLKKGESTWSRQSLSRNENIHVSFNEAKRRLKENRNTHKTNPKSINEYEQIIQSLKSELTELNTKYETLLLRHTQLIYNVSLIEKGNYLLNDLLPDNTKNQTG